MYVILGKPAEGYTEQVDLAEDMETAKYLVNEYRMSFGSGWKVWFKRAKGIQLEHWTKGEKAMTRVKIGHYRAFSIPGTMDKSEVLSWIDDQGTDNQKAKAMEVV